MPFDKQCAHCGKHFIAEREAAKYCNRRCGWDAKVKNIPVNCPTCGKEFTPGQNGKGKKYCSQECYSSDRRGKPGRKVKECPIITCEICGKDFTIFPSRLKQNPRFCSTDCFYKWLNGSERSPRVETNCLTCGEPIRVLKSRYEDNRGRYCSQRCMIRDRPKPPRRVKKVECTCRACSKKFMLYPSQRNGNRGRFCSRQCVISHTNRRMRLNRPTSIEKAIIKELDGRKIKYEFSYSLPPWVIDFAFPDSKLAVEADGVYWHSLDNMKEKDARKDKDLQERGWTILHFSGDEIRASASDCVDEILKHLT